LTPYILLIVPSRIFQFAAPMASFFLSTKSSEEVNRFKTDFDTTLKTLLEKDTKLKGSLFGFISIFGRFGLPSFNDFDWRNFVRFLK
jgi:hypothetical protein